jgi:hypothetical protein
MSEHTDAPIEAVLVRSGPVVRRLRDLLEVATAIRR